MIKLKNILKESNIINLFEQTTNSGQIVSWFKSNKPNTMKNLETAGAAPGDLNQAIPATTKVAELGPGISTIIDQMFRVYGNKGFGNNGVGDEPNKLALKKGQWESKLETIPVKFNTGGQIVTNSDVKTPPVDSRINQFVATDVETRLKSMNSYNIANWKAGKQIINIVPTTVTEDNYSLKSNKQRVRFIIQAMGKAFMNKLILGSTKQQLILWLNYESKSVARPGTPDVQIPAREIPSIGANDGFESGKADLTPAAAASLQTSIATLLESIRTQGINLDDIPVMTIQAGTDREPLARDNPFGDNAKLAEARANTFRNLLIAGGIPGDKIAIDAKTGIEKGAALYTSDPAFVKNEEGQYTSTSAERQAVINQWREDQAPFRFVRLNFGGLKFNGRVIKGKDGLPDKIVQSQIAKKDTARHKQSDEFVYKLTINMLK